MNPSERELVYLAWPHSHPDPAIREQRFHAANRMAGKLMKEGLKVFSPTSHTHPIACDFGLPLGWEFWKEYDSVLLSCCREILIPRVPGWEQSEGIAGEIEIARTIDTQIRMVDVE